VGFDLFLDGRCEIEVYPTITQDELQRVDVRDRITPFLPPRALPLLAQCKACQVGISKANESNILYFNHVFEPNIFIDNLGNEMAKKVHAFYRHQPFQALEVGIPEKDFYASSINHVKLYYLFN
jgi:LynF/TruF/PatF family peptide O-prenyltransferase